MQVFKALSIKHKLILIMMASSCMTIFIMALLIVVNQAINSHRTVQQELITIADVLGSTSTGALSFDDQPSAIEILNTLTLKPNIIYAVIKRADSETFAEFGELPDSASALTNDAILTSDQGPSLSSNLRSKFVYVERDIIFKHKKIGQIKIVSNQDQFHNDLLNFLILVIIISLICFIITLVICTRLQKVVSEPILNLQQTMDSVSRDKDYSVRAENNEENELGSLVDGFNHMLEQVQIRDTKLGGYSSHLEKVVEKRTLQLSEANKKRILWLETMAQFLRHELKNSSVGIKTSLDLIERRASELQKVDIYLDRARKSMTNMNALLQSAGDASNLEATIYKEKQKYLDLSSTVMTHLDCYSTIYPGVPMVVDCQSGIIILGNETRLKQLLDKLISNAVEHSDGSAIEVSVKRHQNQARLIVSNQGDALPSNKNTLFDLFVSLRTPERKTDENFGLGLYIVKLIAESHAGYVAADDLIGATGAVFTVTLPIINAE